MTVSGELSADRHAAVHTAELMLACRTRLDDLNRAFKQRKWLKGSQIAQAYSALLEQLLRLEKSDAEMAELMQLDIRHRRCMRMLSSQMTVVADDISRLQGGEQRVQHSRELAMSIYPH